MHPIYFSHGYREREAPFAAFFGGLMAKVGFLPSLDPPSNDVNSAKLERHLSYTSGLVAVLSNRDTGPSPHILYEISMAVRCGKPVLVFVEDSIEDSVIPKCVLTKRFSEKSYIRETIDHLYALQSLSIYIGKDQLPRYRGFEGQRSCILLGESRLNKELKASIKKILINKGYSIKKLANSRNELPISISAQSEIQNTNLALSVLTNMSASDAYVLGVIRSKLIPTITLSIGDFPEIRGVPNEYQRKIISNREIENDLQILTAQIDLYEEDFIQIDSTHKAEQYANKLALSNTQGHYTHEFRTNIIQEITMGDRYEAGQVGAQGPNSHAHDMNFNQIWNQNRGSIDIDKLKEELGTLRTTLQVQAKSAEDFKEIGDVATAEIAAQNGNGSDALKALSKVGKWSLGVAEKIGIGVAIAAIKTASGF
ncbi:hypothetical protein MN202_03375 [Rheinheimera muenzenbergensis]|uniref:TIR domain-containing protein n=1 Tax=Rheinheimera muenzenbergensis TaxID=1193628 RepID=A0ABU8C3N1_9GAMM